MCYWLGLGLPAREQTPRHLPDDWEVSTKHRRRLRKSLLKWQNLGNMIVLSSNYRVSDVTAQPFNFLAGAKWTADDICQATDRLSWNISSYNPDFAPTVFYGYLKGDFHCRFVKNHADDRCIAKKWLRKAERAFFRQDWDACLGQVVCPGERWLLEAQEVLRNAETRICESLNLKN